MSLAAAIITYPETVHEVGGVVEEPIDAVATFGRIEAQAAKQAKYAAKTRPAR